MAEDAANPNVHPESPAEGSREQPDESEGTNERPAEPAEGSREEDERAGTDTTRESSGRRGDEPGNHP